MVMCSDDENNDKLRPCNSHDVIANMLYVAMMHDNKKLNEKRKLVQMDATRWASSVYVLIYVGQPM